jgi:dTDP-4-amino-4,6-dideoxygalactose transaminase
VGIGAGGLADLKNRSLIRLSKSCIGQEEKAAVMKVLDKEFLGMGEEVGEFERLLSEYFGRPAVCVASGTAALQLALQGAGVGPGDEVLVPTITYLASFQTVTANGARPVACDVDENTCLIDLNDAAKRVTNRTKAIMPVHYAGQPVDFSSLMKLAQKNDLRVIEDAAHAFGSCSKGDRIGSFGDVSCFSFDGIKNITCGEGGCVVSDDEVLLNNIRDARLLGVEGDSSKRFVNQRSWSFEVHQQGWRYHMSNLMAAIGIEQLAKFEQASHKRVLLAEEYLRLLTMARCPCIRPVLQNLDQVVPHIFPLRIFGMNDRKSLVAEMHDCGIQVGLHYQPNHLLRFFSGNDCPSLPVAERIFPELLTLPLHPDLDIDDCSYVLEKLLEMIEQGIPFSS